MPGVYIHIPYCRKACHYCNFHFSTTLRSKPEMLASILTELELQRDFLKGAPLSSVYLGGGTPSLLDISELVPIFDRLSGLHQLEPGAEITLEANPDDLTPEKLRQLRDYTPVKRLSIGIQSFSDADLQWMNRAHNATHARACLEDALKAGFSDLTIDLIYGAPVTSDEQWAENLQTAIEYGIPHLSCYCLTVEEGTALHHFVGKGQQSPVDEEKAARQFEYLQRETERAGYEHYEISNFALPGRYARHNSSYWLGEPYLGIGPAAHSFDGENRQWNIANNALYINSLRDETIPFEREVLSTAQRYNEYVMTSMRTKWGTDKRKIAADFGEFATLFQQGIQSYLESGHIEEDKGIYRLSRTGKLLADRIASDLFVS
ncbi:MAG: radical SAM family heme chaperone HemW [Bacteroidota bacterium]